MNKYHIGLGALLIVILAAGFWFYNSSRNTSSAHMIKIGVIAPLTGPLAEYGEAFRNGILLAEEHSPNKNIQYIIEDSAYDPGKTVSAFYKLRDADQVDIVMNWGDPTSQALAAVMKDSPMPFIAVTTQSNVTQTSPYSIHTLDTADDFAKVLWAYFRSQGKKNIAVVKVQNSYLNNLYSAIDRQKMEGETVTLIDTYQTFGEQDFHTSILKIKKAGKYDEVGIFLGGGQIAPFYKQAAALGLTVATFGSDFFESQPDIDASGSHMNGAVYANYEISDAFRNQYKARFGKIDQISYAGNGYDTVMLLNQINTSDKDVLLASLKSVTNFEGVAGAYHYEESNGDRYLFSPAHIKMIQDGAIKTIN